MMTAENKVDNLIPVYTYATFSHPQQFALQVYHIILQDNISLVLNFYKPCYNWKRENMNLIKIQNKMNVKKQTDQLA